MADFDKFLDPGSCRVTSATENANLIGERQDQDRSYQYNPVRLVIIVSTNFSNSLDQIKEDQTDSSLNM